MNLPFSSNLVSYHFFFKYIDCVASTWTDVHLQWHSAPPSAAPSWAPTFVFFYSRPEPYMTTPTPWGFEKLTGQYSTRRFMCPAHPIKWLPHLELHNGDDSAKAVKSAYHRGTRLSSSPAMLCGCGKGILLLRNGCTSSVLARGSQSWSAQISELPCSQELCLALSCLVRDCT
ncbi:hypothetical protein M438DRAFT_402616 [Aureobasidium pullulans EXF-150]|uniref:Uncharacterized protein n=1 Tax=Aureobasidium pullulans EXF-150 TaxID=1043002 RepID=A0A074XT68_AURPU|nr:uncharacterized protein M438DRAFT_402616 [Aureobasidium pullulans EXF-150]KEQ88808.1 hypothetical protein M438DRAFT_402616 [Aureobasidium pullulans EXF-150]